MATSPPKSPSKLTTDLPSIRLHIGEPEESFQKKLEESLQWCIDRRRELPKSGAARETLRLLCIEQRLRSTLDRLKKLA